MASQAGPNQWPPYPQVPHFRNDSDTLFDRMSRSSQGSGTSQSTLGLGIMNDSSREESSSASASSTPEHGKPCSGLAQRIERSLWQWSSSESFAARWLFEIISWTISAISMGAFIGILVVLKDKEVPDWPLNLVLSLLSRTAAGALILPVSEALGQLKWSWFQKNSQKMWDFEVFDDASRGPWGSALLLIRTRGRTLAALGAAVTLLALALDPFFQQVADFPDRWVLQGASSIPKVQRYEPEFSREIRAGLISALPDQRIQAVTDAFFYGNGTQSFRFNNGTRPDIPLSCPTSNCTWPVYETLGMCSSCTDLDVAEFLTFACHRTRVDWIANLTGYPTEPKYPNGTVCGYFLNETSPDRLLMSGYNLGPLNSSAGTAFAREALLVRMLPLLTYPGKKPLYGGSINFKHIYNPIADVLIVGATDGPNSVYRNETPILQECALYWCVKRIKSSYYWGEYKEEVLSTLTNTTAGPSPWKVVVLPPQNGVSLTDMSFTQNITIKSPSTQGPNPEYGMSNGTAFRNSRLFDDIFPGFLTVKNPSAEPLLRYKFWVKGPMQRTFSFNPWLSPNNIPQHLDRLATAITNSMRSSPSSETVMGMAFGIEQFVKVTWTWLILPLFILVLTLIFLVATILKTREKDSTGIFKNSAFATVLSSMPPEMRRKITEDSATGKAREMRVKYIPDKGWRVSGFNFSPKLPHGGT